MNDISGSGKHEAGTLDYFDIQASMGTTKHMGGLAATRDLVTMCEVTGKDRVLEVGSGAGATSCWLAERFDCRVTGVDVHPEMVRLGTSRAQRCHLQDMVTFREGSVEALPFRDGEFDVVLCESVLSFVEDKQQALDECFRVLSEGGRLGLNEEIWLREPTDEEAAAVQKLWSMSAGNMMAEDWKHMLQEAGFHTITSRSMKLEAWRDASQVLRYSIGEMVKMFARAFWRFATEPDFRAYMRERRSVPRGLFKALRYGLYCGMKEAG